jgi:hypothetical protein
MKLFIRISLLCTFLLPLASMAATPKEEAQQLVDAILPFAQQMLSKHKEFYPFGAQLNNAGKVEQVGAYNGNEHPPSAELIDLLHAGFVAKAKAGQVRATALAYDVRVQPPGSSAKSDAVAVELEHRDGYNVTVYFPYTIQNGAAPFGTPFTTAGPHRVFGGGS